MQSNVAIKPCPLKHATAAASSRIEAADDVVELAVAQTDRESPGENYRAEIDGWARRALAANGFGDY